MKTPYFIEKIDWSELRNQKTALINHIEFLRKDQSEVNQIKTKNELADHLEGLLGLIDAVQDYAVDEIGLNPYDIFDFEMEDGRDEESNESTDSASSGQFETLAFPVIRRVFAKLLAKEELFAREQAEIIFQMHIEGSFIYENEVMSEEFIKSILDDEQHATAIKNIIRHAILKDIQNGTITTLEYNIEMYDYGYKIEDYCMEQFYKDKTKTLWVCPICGSDNVQFKTWTDANIFQATCDECPMEDQDCHCKDCESNATLFLQEMPYLKEVIGFQVIGHDGVGHKILHPKMENNSCVYNLSQAREMIDEYFEDWRNFNLVTIWSGDIEEPTMMFKGNPRD